MAIEFILHAGIHKTASTSLQELVFPNTKDAYYTGKSRHIREIREIKLLKPLLCSGESINKTIERLPTHSCLFYLGVLQDYLVAELARGFKPISDLNDLIALNRLLLRILEDRHEKLCILYSCEGLLLSRGHITPRHGIGNLDSYPLKYHELLFPGQVSNTIVYLRSPLEYLYSRYIQIHTLGYYSRDKNAGRRALSPEKYLSLAGKLWHGPCRSQSVFFHVFQRELIASIEELGIPVRARSYERHIRSTSAISSEIHTAFGLDLHSPEKVDLLFKTQPLNITRGEKADAVELLLGNLGLISQEELKRSFVMAAERDPVLKRIDDSLIFND